MKKIVGTAILLASNAAMAADTTLRIGEDALSLYFNPAATATNSVQFAMVYNDDADSALVSAGLFANGQRDTITGRLGGKVYYADLDHDSGYGLALGGDFSFNINSDLSLNAGLFYGPGSLSFSDVDGYQEWFVRLNYSVFENAKLGVGYGSFDIEPEQGKDIELEDGLFFEMTLRF